jgi:Tol biopolymer transport system component/tRNA A-37 threonylcarbamoyl transferase component Bud32
MGVVYRARDARLDRFVALKVLRSDSADSPDRERRFMQEARAASALNHPNIVTVYDVGTVADARYIAMECVEGVTLREAIGATGLPLERVLDIGAQIADALSVAHRAGILHRDLKPGNIMVSGHLVKVLDFGLAKMMERLRTAAGNDLTRTRPAFEQVHTAIGVITGTVAYMSPEQVEGKPLGPASDVFSFGCVLYEMTTGHAAFGTESTIRTIAAVLNRTPRSVLELRPEFPEELAALISACLNKSPANRPALTDVKQTLDDLRRLSRSSATFRRSVFARPGAEMRQRILGLVTAAAVVAAIAGGWRWRSVRVAEPPPLTQLKRLTSDSGLNAFPALSPDGKLLAFASDRAGEGALNIWVRQVAGGEAIRLTHGMSDDQEPAFSPDGSQIVFSSDRNGGGIFIMSALGGEPRQVAKGGRRPRFSPDGRSIAFFTGSRGNSGSIEKIYLVQATGGAPMAWHPEFSSAMDPVWSPDSRFLLFMGKRDPNRRWPDGADWWIAPVVGGEPHSVGAFDRIGRQAILDFAAPEAWVSPNDIVFSQRVGDSTNVWRVSLSARYDLTEPPRRLTFGSGLELQPAVSATGGVAFASYTERLNVWALPIDPQRGSVAGDLKQLTRSEAIDGTPSISLDGAWLAFVSNRDGSDRVWLHDVRFGREIALTGERSVGGSMVLARDGSRVAWESQEKGKSAIYTMAVNGGVPEKVCDDCGNPLSWAIDDGRLLYQTGNSAFSRFFLLDLATRQSMPIMAHPHGGVYAANISADGAWVTFHVRASAEPGSQQIHVAPFRAAPVPPSEWIPITSGEFEDDKPRWSADGGAIYFTSLRDGYRCLWSQRLDPVTKRPIGGATSVYHFHSAQFSMLYPRLIRLGVSVARDKIVFTVVGRTANLWLATPE